ncbi:uncharacterized protein G2W53_023772 [Senna tora]|uniref:Uncharacterized protein n=1 Tax=Senna tora TaxID=362788 RepID=A0A834WD92_9FABA|nr:uncharacterized protein G2W53_023772 [Senna tora]
MRLNHVQQPLVHHLPRSVPARAYKHPLHGPQFHTPN